MMLSRMRGRAVCCATGLLLSLRPQPTAADGDIPKTFTAPATDYDYVKREVMIPMRDGVKLHTVIVVPADPHAVQCFQARQPQ